MKLFKAINTKNDYSIELTIIAEDIKEAKNIIREHNKNSDTHLKFEIKEINFEKPGIISIYEDEFINFC